MSTLKALNKKLNDVLDTEGCEWLKQERSRLAQLTGDLECVANKLVFLTTTVKRKLGMASLGGEINSGFNPDIYGQCNKIYLDYWSVTDASRIILLADILSLRPLYADELLQLCYHYSDDGERASILKGLSLLKLSDQSINFIIDVARTNSLEIFSALAYKNPWPVIRFPVSSFNQVVLKSLFLGINIIHLEGLRAARNTELGRMTADYVQERLDAGREIPESIWLAVDASLLSDQGLSAWESALKEVPTESKNQLALVGCQWQSDLPTRINEIALSFNNL